MRKPQRWAGLLAAALAVAGQPPQKFVQDGIAVALYIQAVDGKPRPVREGGTPW